jgi:hypothetical protein
VELVVQQSSVGNSLKRGRLNWPAERRKRTESDIVQHDEQHIRAIRRATTLTQSAGFGVNEQPRNMAIKRL